MTTMGTWLHTLIFGRLVGKDAEGREYYESNKPTRRGGGRMRCERWVIYRRGEDASAVPPEWWNWLHHVENKALPVATRRPWQRVYKPNVTGTAEAYHLPGSDYKGGYRAAATGDYEAWFPDSDSSIELAKQLP